MGGTPPLRSNSKREASFWVVVIGVSMCIDVQIKSVGFGGLEFRYNRKNVQVHFVLLLLFLHFCIFKLGFFYANTSILNEILREIDWCQFRMPIMSLYRVIARFLCLCNFVRFSKTLFHYERFPGLPGRLHEKLD